MRPRLLLLDEPLSALDAGLRERLAGDLRRILVEAGTTAVLVTHDHEEAFAVADRMALMRAGRVVQHGPVADVWGAPVDAEAALFLGYARVLDGARAAAVLAAAGRPGAPAVALRRSALRVEPAGALAGTVVSAAATPDQVRLVADVEGLGRLDAVGGPGLAAARVPAPGAAVRLDVDPARLAPLRRPPAENTLNALAGREVGNPKMCRVYRRAYALLVGVAGGMLLLALFTANALGRSIVDPEGFLGPAWARGPLLILLALTLDMVPRALWYSKLDVRKMPGIVRERWRTHWTRDRLVLVVLGLVCFYVTYVSYRNLKSFLPEVLGTDYMFDRELHQIDQLLFFGNEPAIVLHSILGYEVVAQFLSLIYIWYLPLVPLAVTAWAIWSRNISFGYWFATSQVLAWTLGTASYYLLPTLGPGFEYSWLYTDLPQTPTTDLMQSLHYGRSTFLWNDVENAIQGVAGSRACTPRSRCCGRSWRSTPCATGSCTGSSGSTSASRSSPPSTSAGTTSPTTSAAS